MDSFQDVADGQGRNIKWKQLADMCAEAPPAQSTEQVTNGDHPEGELEDGGESSTSSLWSMAIVLTCSLFVFSRSFPDYRETSS